MTMTNFMENAVVNHFLRNTSQTSPTTVYVALFTAAPGEGGGGTEVTGGSYARVAATFDAPAGGVTQNTSDISFPQATASWGTVTHGALFDALTGGNMMVYGALTTSKTVGNGDTVKFVTGDLALTLD